MTRTIAIVASLLLAGCGKTVVDSACASFSPITYSAAQDSEETKNQVKKHNAAWEAVCK